MFLYRLHQEQDRLYQHSNTSLWPTTTYLAVLAVLLAGIFVIANVRGVAYYTACIRCSRGIHSQMFQAVIGTSLSFFHNNSSGQVTSC
ncbi:hypothetical protein J6590_098613 [Homalodisca vitripennis]|nr:hypothetical protein J6590_098613 [Homalodisca vitripennis]